MGAVRCLGAALPQTRNDRELDTRHMFRTEIGRGFRIWGLKFRDLPKFCRNWPKTPKIGIFENHTFQFFSPKTKKPIFYFALIEGPYMCLHFGRRNLKIGGRPAGTDVPKTDFENPRNYGFSQLSAGIRTARPRACHQSTRLIELYNPYYYHFYARSRACAQNCNFCIFRIG